MTLLLRVIAATLSFGILPTAAAEAAVTINVTQSGSDVVATASGSLNLIGLSVVNPNSANTAGVCAACSDLVVGPAGAVAIYGFGGTGPSSFGGGTGTLASSGAGDAFSFDIFTELGVQKMEIGVPVEFVNGSTITGSATFTNQNFVSLSLTPGVYTYALPNDTITLNVAAVPEPATWAMMLLGFGGIGFALRRLRHIFAVA